MAKERERVCIYYQCEGGCLKGREGTFRDYCQTCDKYAPLKGAKPARKNLKKQKLADARNREIKREMKGWD